MDARTIPKKGGRYRLNGDALELFKPRDATSFLEALAVDAALDVEEVMQQAPGAPSGGKSNYGAKITGAITMVRIFCRAARQWQKPMSFGGIYLMGLIISMSGLLNFHF